MLLSLTTSLSADQNAAFKGEIKWLALYSQVPSDSLAHALGANNHGDGAVNLRLMGGGRFGSYWNWDAAWVLDLRRGEDVELNRRLRAYDPSMYAPPQQRNALDLQDTLTDKGLNYAAQYIDRLNIGYSGQNAIIRVGRQALTWGSGLVFHPMDVSNSFAPNAIDTEYKPGADMLYAQWLFESGADVQGTVIPRQNPATHRIESDQSAAALKWHGFLDTAQQYGYQLLAARNYGASTFGIALSGSLGGTTWAAEAIPVRLDDGKLTTSWLLNMQYAWSCFSKNCSGYAEYFRNGFGVTGSGHALDGLPESLLQRLARQEVFTVSRDYAAFGLTLEWTPLLKIKPMLISNLNDGSMLAVAQVAQSLSDNADLTLAVQSGIGPHGTEYGGMQTAAGSGMYVAPERFVYLRLDLYF